MPDHCVSVHHGRRPLDRAVWHRPAQHNDQKDMHSALGAVGKCSRHNGMVCYVRWPTCAPVDCACFRTSSFPSYRREELTGLVRWRRIIFHSIHAFVLRPVAFFV